MKNLNTISSGFVWLPVLLGVLVVLAIGGAYVWETTKTTAPTEPIYTPTTSHNNTGVVSQQKVQPYLVTSPDYVGHPKTEDWITIGLPHITGIQADVTGWSVRSAQSGKIFTIGTIPANGTGTPRKVVIGEDSSVTIHTVGSPTKSYSAEGETHLYFGEPQVAWGKDHDTIQLVDPSGVVVDTYLY
ncbi:MAG: hypothetical protein Q7S26_01685 [bacterium]|nr:hypothetical protein [bacterium]